MSKNSERKLDPRVVRTRKMLRDALMALIPELGYGAITVRHITDRAALNHATFYLHYRDKNDLLQHIIDDVLEELASAPAFVHNPVEAAAARDVFVYLFDHVARHGAFYRVMLHEPSVAPFAGKIQQEIEAIGMRWLARAHRTPQDMLTPPDLFISFIGAAYLGVVKWWVLNSMPYPSDYMAAQFMRLTIGGIQHEFGMSDVSRALEAELRHRRGDKSA